VHRADEIVAIADALFALELDSRNQ
jgi:hypothetical protein